MGQVCCSEDQNKYEKSDIRNTNQSNYSQDQLKRLLVSNYSIPFICINQPEFSFFIFLEKDKVDAGIYTTISVQQLGQNEFLQKYPNLKVKDYRNLQHPYNSKKTDFTLDLLPMYFTISDKQIGNLQQLYPNKRNQSDKLKQQQILKEQLLNLEEQEKNIIKQQVYVFLIRGDNKKEAQYYKILLTGSDTLGDLKKVLKEKIRNQQYLNDQNITNRLTESESTRNTNISEDVNEVSNQIKQKKKQQEKKKMMENIKDYDFHLFQKAKIISLDGDKQQVLISQQFPFTSNTTLRQSEIMSESIRGSELDLKIQLEQNQNKNQSNKDSDQKPKRQSKNSTGYGSSIIQQQKMMIVNLQVKIKIFTPNITEKDIFQPIETQLANETEPVIKGDSQKQQQMLEMLHRKVIQGINLEIICKNEECVLANKRQIINIKKARIYDFKQRSSERCMNCSQKSQILYVGIYRSKFGFVGIFTDKKKHGGLDWQYVGDLYYLVSIQDINLKQFESFKIVTEQNNWDERKDQTIINKCGICLKVFSITEKQMPNCSHSYHFQCYSKLNQKFQDVCVVCNC